jgi:hypothetical protein
MGLHNTCKNNSGIIFFLGVQNTAANNLFPVHRINLLAKYVTLGTFLLLLSEYAIMEKYSKKNETPYYYSNQQ